MTVTVTSVTPSKVASAGRTMVEIIGTGFRQQTVAPATSTGPLPPPAPSVRVFFGTDEALRVRVISPTRLLVTVPPHDPGQFDVRVENIDDFGAMLESGTRAKGIEFALPSLVGEGELVRIVRTLIRELKRQVVPEVILTSSIDWDDAPFELPRSTAEAKLPAVWLNGPTLRQSDGLTAQVSPLFSDDSTGTTESRSPRTVDLVFGYSIIADSGIVALNLIQAATSFTVRNKRLSVARDPSNASAGTIEFDLELDADFNMESTPNEDGLFSASATLSIRAVDVLGMPNFTSDLVTDRHPVLTSCPTIETMPR